MMKKTKWKFEVELLCEESKILRIIWNELNLWKLILSELSDTVRGQIQGENERPEGMAGASSLRYVSEPPFRLNELLIPYFHLAQGWDSIQQKTVKFLSLYREIHVDVGYGVPPSLSLTCYKLEKFTCKSFEASARQIYCDQPLKYYLYRWNTLIVKYDSNDNSFI